MAKLEKQKPKNQQVVVTPPWLQKLRERGIWGLVLLALSVVTLIGLFSRTSGTLLDSWSNLLLKTFGWGSYVVVLAAVVFSVLTIIDRLPPRESLPWQAIVGIEVAFVLLLGLIHLVFFNADPWRMAQAGSGGGLVGAVFGAVLSEMVGPWLTGTILVLALLGDGLFMAGLTVQEWLELLEDWTLALRERAGKVLVNRLGRPAQGTKAEIASAATEPAVTSQSIAASQPTPVSQPSTQTPLAPARAPKRFKIELPPLTLLSEPEPAEFNQADTERKAKIIEETLGQFGVPAQVVEKNWGPRVTQFGVEPGYVTRRDPSGEESERKIRVSKIASLSNDLALALAAAPIRIEAPVPGRSIVGIEVPNDRLAVVPLRQVLESRAFRRGKSALTLALGNGVAGHPIVADLTKMPHLLIAGATGSGKSACINAIVVALLFQNSPLTLRMVMIDPKRVELTRYSGIPHLFGDVEVDVQHVVHVLEGLVEEMQARYKKLSEVGARHIEEYNQRWQIGSSEYMPRIVVLIDELADLMFFAPEEAEKYICRLAQMARAVGIHLVLATQRPSVDVVTGLIKANFPARIAFAVTTGIDSRVIIDAVGAETLLGQGDMLFMSPDSSKLRRIQGSWVSDEESYLVAQYWQAWAEEQGWEAEPVPWNNVQASEPESDELLDQAIEIVQEEGSASAALLQRRMRIGYPRAASLIDELEAQGIVGPAEKGGRPRKVIGLNTEIEGPFTTMRSEAP